MDATNCTQDIALSPNEGDEAISSECKALLPTLEKKEWMSMSLYKYKGFWFYSRLLSSYLSFYRHFQPLDDDLILSSFMKSGTTWIKALAFAITNRRIYPLTSPDHPLLHASPHELILMFEFEFFNKDYPGPDISTLSSPRLLGTHIPFNLLPISIKDSRCKIIYLCREPKDNFCSLWNFTRKIRKGSSMASLEEALDSFCNGITPFGPLWDHVLGYWNASQENPQRVLFLRYEDVIKEPAANVKRLAEFMGFPFSPEEVGQSVVDQIVNMCSFESMRNLEVNKVGTLPLGAPKSAFFGSGQVGKSATVLEDHMINRIDDITETKLPGFWSNAN